MTRTRTLRASKVTIAGPAVMIIVAACGAGPTSGPTGSTSPEVASSSAARWPTTPYTLRQTRTSAGPAQAMPDPTQVDQHNASAVALSGVRALLECDTTLDADPNQTAQRAIAWLAPRFASGVLRDRPIAGPGAEWNTWAVHRAYCDVTTTLGADDRPVDTARTAYRQVVATVRPIGRDRWRGPAQRVVVFVTLARGAPTPGVWRVAAEKSVS